MHERYYQQYAAVEDNHWWFRGRRAILSTVIAGLDLPADATILEVGSGTGGNLAMLANVGALSAVEMNAQAAAIGTARGFGQVELGSLPDQLPVSDTFDLVVALDVIEHIENDVESLRALLSRVNSTGKLLLTVPALNLLWGHHDVVNHHFRRYNSTSLRRAIEAAGGSVERLTYFNSLLLAPALASRLTERFRNNNIEGTSSDLNIPSHRINQALYRIFASERKIIQTLRLPVGASLMASVVPRRLEHSNS